MTIFVTGGAGYIGSHTCLELLSQGYKVVAADNFINSKADVPEKLKRLNGADFPFYKADIRDKAALDKIFEDHKIDCVIHFAGLKAVGESVRNPLEYYDNNLISTLVLCETMKKHGVKSFVFSSSATVYSPGPQPLTEISPTGGCTNPYGWTKYMIERMLTDIASADPGWSVVLLRYFNPIGAHPSGEIGEDPNNIPTNLLPYITQTAAGRLPYLPVYGGDYPTPDGTCIRDYIHVMDLARGHVSAINYAKDNKGAETFNLGTGLGTSVLEMIEAFKTSTGMEVPFKMESRRAGDQPVSYAATDKAFQKLGFKAEKTVAQACADSWRWESSGK